MVSMMMMMLRAHPTSAVTFEEDASKNVTNYKAKNVLKIIVKLH